MVLIYFEGLTDLSEGAAELLTFLYLTEKQIIDR